MQGEGDRKCRGEEWKSIILCKVKSIYLCKECVCFFYVTGLMVKKDLTGKEPFEQRPEETLVS